MVFERNLNTKCDMKPEARIWKKRIIDSWIIDEHRFRPVPSVQRNVDVCLGPCKFQKLRFDELTDHSQGQHEKQP